MYVYFIQPAREPEGVYKIGLSNSPTYERLIGYKDGTRYLMHYETHGNCATIEQELISKFNEVFDIYKGSEYFKIPNSKLHVAFEIFASVILKDNKSREHLVDTEEPEEYRPKKRESKKIESTIDPTGFNYERVDGLTINTETGFINFTRLSVDYSQSKDQNKKIDSQNSRRLNNWTRTSPTTKLIRTIAEQENVEPGALFFQAVNVHNVLKGTYFHPKLKDKFMDWLNGY